MPTPAVKLTLGDDGILVAAMDLPGRPMNVVADSLMAGIEAAVERLAEADVKGLILTSDKADFCAGGDIDRMSAWSNPQEPFDASMAMKAVLRRLETQGKPVVAAINGHALGGGLEIALACHARIAIDDARLKLGQPEVKLGLLPGGGGTVRLSRLVGIQQALQICAEGHDIPVPKALGIGLLSETAKDRDDLLARSRAWILANPKAAQPWDLPKFKFPGGDSRSPAVVQMWTIAPSIAAARSFGNYPAIQHIMSAIFEGGLVDFDNACVVESRYFAACVTSQESRNMIHTLWYQLNAIRKGASRPHGVPASKVRKLGILGAGMMGAGIAYVSAKAGLDVVLLDTTMEAAERGKAHSRSLLDKAVRKGRSTPEKRDALLARITPGTDHALLAGCDLVVEAVFEDRSIKAEVTRKAEAVIGEHAVFASNTSTLPITGLAETSVRPGSFIGLHFFSPVDKMPLVEIIVGARTSPETLARGFDFVLQIGKTPIVVNDSRGFYTSRVFATYVMEGLAMLKEGVHPRSIEAAGLQAGMPMPPLALQDEVSLSLSLHVAEQARKDMAAEGNALVEHPRDAGDPPDVRDRPHRPQGRQGLLRLGRGAAVAVARAGRDVLARGPAARTARAGRPADVRAGQRGGSLPAGRRAALGGGRQHRFDPRLGLCAVPRRHAAVHRCDRRQGLCRAIARTCGPARRALRAGSQRGRAGCGRRAFRSLTDQAARCREPGIDCRFERVSGTVSVAALTPLPKAQWRAYASILLRRRAGLRSDQPLPLIGCGAHGVKLSANWLAAYRALIGLPDEPAVLPPLALQIAAAPLHLEILSDPGFPFPALGLVHVGQRVDQTCAQMPGAAMQLDAFTGRSRPAARGTYFEIVTEARREGRLVWRSIATVLARHASTGQGAPAPAAPAALDVAQAPQANWLRTQLITAPEDLGRRYAAIAGDWNPIHQRAWLARRFGFERAIVHGTWTLARALVAADWPSHEAFSLQADFCKPVLLPSSLAVWVRQGPSVQSLRVTDAAGSIEHVVARIEPALAGSH